MTAINVFGLGYVGTVSAACLADRGHRIIGVDPNPAKVSLLNGGKAPIVETGLDALIGRVTASGMLTATQSAEVAVQQSDVSLICVGTPSLANGLPDLAFLEQVCRELGAHLKEKPGFHVVVVRSTVPPGTMHRLVIPLLEATSGKRAGEGFGVCNNPEFLREGSALHDFLHPARTVIGETDRRSGDLVQTLYDGLPGEIIRCAIEVAEAVKYADNAWHATKVAFANEIGKLCKTFAIDSHAVMDIFCRDTKLNISPAYLKPGFAFGGSCLPKDVRALTALARNDGVATPLLDALLPTNEAQIEWGIRQILACDKKTVGFLGFSFKPGTDDLRESPLVDVIERLIGKGYDLRLYDRNVQLARLLGANRDYIHKTISHIERLMVETPEAAVSEAEIVVIGHADPQFADVAALLRPEQTVIDFVRIPAIEASHENYHGICW